MSSRHIRPLGYREDAPLIHVPTRRPKPSTVLDTYWRFAVERQEVFFRRFWQGGDIGSATLTSDPILQAHKFTNAYRASDRVSQFLIRKVIYEGEQTAPELVFRVLLFKLFNKVETWELLIRAFGEVTWRGYSFERYDSILSDAMASGARIYSGAYIMPTARGFGDDARKHRTHLRLLELMMRDELPARIIEATSMEEAFLALRHYPMMGDFLAYQFVTDINYSALTDFSESEFVVPGPGARDGLRKCFEDYGELSEADLIRYVAERQEQECELRGLTFRTLWGRPLQFIDCQNLFCETDKYARVAHPEVRASAGRTRIKQRYRPNPKPIEYWYPPKWGLNAAVDAERMTTVRR